MNQIYALTYLGRTVDVLYVKDGPQTEEEDLGEGGHQLRLRHHHVDAILTRFQHVQALHGFAVPLLENEIRLWV